ncbi:MAG: integrase, partial [Hungatella sp.]
MKNGVKNTYPYSRKTRTITSAWEYVSAEIRKMRAKDVRARHLKGVMEDGYRIETRGKNKGQKVLPTASTKSRIKSMFNLMFDYALEHEIVERNYARTFDVSDEIIKEIDSVKRNHFPFNDSEQKILWENVDRVKYVDWILIQCYMGWRPQELATLRLDDVNLTERYIRGGMKTEAGIQRIVPIHSRIFYLVQKNYNLAVELGSEYLFNSKGQTHAGSYTLTYD